MNKWEEEELKHLYYIHSLTDREIGKLKGVSRARVEQMRKRFGIKGIKKRPYGRRINGSKETQGAYDL